MVSAASRKTIDLAELQRLEASFRAWADASAGRKRRWSRRRVLLIFLLIRYSGARLNEILSLNPATDIDLQNQRIAFRRSTPGEGGSRQVQIPQTLAEEIAEILAELQPDGPAPDLLRLDPAHVRRKFYACSEAAGIERELGTPEALRRSRAVELMQRNVPLPVVQKILGHSTPNLAAAYVHFSAEEIGRIERFHVKHENQRRTSARNSFFGKIEGIRRGDVQSTVRVLALDGLRVESLVTNDSLTRLGLKPGALAAAEVKAPWVQLFKGNPEPACSAENRLRGTVRRVLRGSINSEVVVRVSPNTELCAILSEARRDALAIEAGDEVWALFGAAMVVLHVE
jgi:molybdate transport system regulatory protein